MPSLSSSSSTSFSSLSPLVKQDLAKLDCGDLDTRRIAMAALKGYVGQLDCKTMPFFLDQVSDYEEASRPYAISLFVEVARVHQAAVAPFIPRIMCSVLHSLRTTGGTATQQHLQHACAGVVAALAAHTVGNDGVVLVQICRPLLSALRSRLEPLAAGAAACLQALVESKSWGTLAPPELREELCRRSIAALADKGTRTLPHLRLARALSSLHPDVILGRYSASLLSSASLILHPGSPSSWQQRSIAAELIHSVLQSPRKPPPPHELDAAVHALALWRHDRVPAVRTAVSNALKSIDSPLSYTPTSSSSSSSSSTPHSSKNRGRRRDNYTKPLSFISTPLSSPLPNDTFAITPSVSGMSHSPLLSVTSTCSSISLSRFNLPHNFPDQGDPENNGLFAQDSLADEYFLSRGGLSGNLLTQEEEETLGLGDSVDLSLRFDKGGQRFFDQSLIDGASYCGSSDPLKEAKSHLTLEDRETLGLSNRVEFSLIFDSADQGYLDQSSKDAASYCGSNDPLKEDEELDFLRRGVATQDKVDFSLMFDSGNWGYLDNCSKGEEGPPEVSMSNGPSYCGFGDLKENKQELGFPTQDLETNKFSPSRRRNSISLVFDKESPSKEEDSGTHCSSISYTLSGVVSFESGNWGYFDNCSKGEEGPPEVSMSDVPPYCGSGDLKENKQELGSPTQGLENNKFSPSRRCNIIPLVIDKETPSKEEDNSTQCSSISYTLSGVTSFEYNISPQKVKACMSPEDFILFTTPRRLVRSLQSNSSTPGSTITLDCNNTSDGDEDGGEAMNMGDANTLSSEKSELGWRRENHCCAEGEMVSEPLSPSLKMALSPSTGSCISENSNALLLNYAEDRASVCDGSTSGSSSSPSSPTSRGAVQPLSPSYSQNIHMLEENEEKMKMPPPPLLMKLDQQRPLLYKRLRRVHHCAEMFLLLALCFILAFFIIMFFKSQQEEYHHNAMVPT